MIGEGKDDRMLDDCKKKYEIQWRFTLKYHLLLVSTLMWKDKIQLNSSRKKIVFWSRAVSGFELRENGQGSVKQRGFLKFYSDNP